MKFGAKDYAKALMETLELTAPNNESQVLDNFVKVLAENNDLRLFSEISDEFHKFELARKGIKQVEITSAHPINHENEKQILEELNKLAKQKVEIKKSIDENLVGGVVIRMDDRLLDASVKNDLEQLKQELIQ